MLKLLGLRFLYQSNPREFCRVLLYIATHGWFDQLCDCALQRGAVAAVYVCRHHHVQDCWVSSLFFDGYAKLNNKEKLEWNNRGFSSLHAILVAASSLYLLIASDLFNVGSEDKVLMINRTSTFSDTVMAMSIGYFLSDLAMIIYQFPALGGFVYILHHGLSMFSIIQSLLSGQAQVYIMMVLFTESTTPFVNMRWYLDTAGKKNSTLYTINGLALFLGWLIARILLFVYLFYHMVTYFDQVKLVYPMGFYSLLAVPPLLTAMNAFWFWKIARGLMKALTKSGHSN